MKLGRFAIMMIGITVFIVAVSWGFIIHYLPDTKEAGMLEENKRLQDAEAAKMPQAKNRTKKAIAMIDAKAQDWQKYVETRTPPMNVKDGGIDLSVDAWQLSIYTPKFRDSIQRAVNNQVKKGGIKVINGPYVQPIDANLSVNEILPSFYNYPALKFPVVIYDFGTITVQGTYKQILDNVRAYKYMPHYLAVADGLRIDGTSPNLTGTYNLTVVGFIRTKSIAPPVNEGAAAAGGGAPGVGAAGRGGGGGGGGAGAGRGGGGGGGGAGGGGGSGAQHSQAA